MLNCILNTYFLDLISICSILACLLCARSDLVTKPINKKACGS